MAAEDVKVVYDGWSAGMKKVALTKLLREKGGLPLSEAKTVTDRVLDGERVVLDGFSDKKAAKIVRKSSELGAKCHVEA